MILALLKKIAAVTVLSLSSWAVGCGAAAALDKVSNPQDDVTLSNCRAEGRDAQAHDAAADAAMGVYTDCKKEAGF